MPNSGSSTLLKIIYHLCPVTNPGQQAIDRRRLLWSANLATLFERHEIEAHRRGDSDVGKAYLKRVIERLRKAIDRDSNWSIPERVTAGVALGKLGDRRPGVGLITPPTDRQKNKPTSSHQSAPSQLPEHGEGRGLKPAYDLQTHTQQNHYYQLYGFNWL